MRERVTYSLIFVGSLIVMAGLASFIFHIRAVNAVFIPSKTIVEVTTKNFDDEVLDSPLPVFIEFYVSEGCDSCRNQVPSLNKLEKEYAGKVKFVRVQADKQATISRNFKLQVVPTHLILKMSDKMIFIKEGPADEAALREFIDKALAAKPKEPEQAPPPPETPETTPDKGTAPTTAPEQAPPAPETDPKQSQPEKVPATTPTTAPPAPPNSAPSTTPALTPPVTPPATPDKPKEESRQE